MPRYRKDKQVQIKPITVKVLSKVVLCHGILKIFQNRGHSLNNNHGSGFLSFSAKGNLTEFHGRVET